MNTDAAADRITIRTPENIELFYTAAGMASRFLALFIDLLIQTLATIILVIIFVSIGAALRTEAAQAALAAAAIGIIFLLQIGYFIFFETVRRGQTPGKRSLGIRVIRESGQPLDFTSSTVRNLIRIIDALPGTYAVGAVSVFLSRKSKRLGDLVAGTVVVYDLSLQNVRPWIRAGSLYQPAEEPRAYISPEVRGLVYEFLSRANSLAPDAERELSTRLAGIVEQETGQPRREPDPVLYLRSFFPTPPVTLAGFRTR